MIAAAILVLFLTICLSTMLFLGHVVRFQQYKITNVARAKHHALAMVVWWCCLAFSSFAVGFIAAGQR